MPDSEKTTSALDELRDDPTSRKKFLTRVGGTGGVAAMAVLLGACGSSNNSSSTSTPAAAGTTAAAASGGSEQGDLDILNYALTLEHLETDFYNKVIAAGLFKGAQADLLKHFGESEQQHVDALTATIKKLGGTPVAAPKSKFPIKDAMSVAKLAATVENLGAAAYLAQAPKIKNAEVLAAALSIHSVEARHAATLNTLIGKKITPDGAFGKPAEMSTVLAAVKPFIVA
ncbi:ferritin-like domain-containing protein [Paraconexibacter antarcticus]|uniref:Ferritin-like domain-containing protein n=1 Tax=Paraconexibacter antarcticus TaxID=2949664 RepID=A0ABY5DUQ5_9ACTN|nr:ferritin-like domain-containing protein [Paraconexibacter antarcticus]UTI64254.1 ferritin-like domain-containing protein [Paraconexibacter antarcticus]